MIRKSKKRYYQLPFVMYSCAVDEQLKGGLESLAEEFRGKLLALLRKNKEHVHKVYKGTCYPNGKSTDYRYSLPKSNDFPEGYLNALEEELVVKDCGLVIETDESYSYDLEVKLRGIAQKILEGNE